MPASRDPAPSPTPEEELSYTTCDIEKVKSDHIAGKYNENLALGRTGRSMGRLRASSEVIRKFLESKKHGLDEKGRTRFIQIIQCMFNIATNPKSMKQVEAAKFLIERAYGKAKPSEDELDAMAKGGVRIVLVNQPTDVPEQVALPAPKPDFIEAEFRGDE